VAKWTTPMKRHPSISRWRSPFPVRGLMPLILAALLGGCTTAIVPPAAPQNPQTVFLLDHGRHTSLVLPHSDGVVRYAYGDWRWYAAGETGLRAGSAAVLRPTPAALGRRLLAGPATEEGVRQSVGVVIEHLYPLRVETERVARLRDELDALHQANRASLRYNPAADLEFVHHPEEYSAFHNSNHMIAAWLTSLGCEIRGSASVAKWRMD